MISGVHHSLLFVWVPVMIISDHYRSSNPSLDTWDLHIQYHHCTQSNLKQYKLHRYCPSLVLMVADQSRCSFGGDKECGEILFGRDPGLEENFTYKNWWLCLYWPTDLSTGWVAKKWLYQSGACILLGGILFGRNTGRGSTLHIRIDDCA